VHTVQPSAFKLCPPPMSVRTNQMKCRTIFNPLYEFLPSIKYVTSHTARFLQPTDNKSKCHKFIIHANSQQSSYTFACLTHLYNNLIEGSTHLYVTSVWLWIFVYHECPKFLNKNKSIRSQYPKSVETGKYKRKFKKKF
jgi:hypothetical protein